MAHWLTIWLYLHNLWWFFITFMASQMANLGQSTRRLCSTMGHKLYIKNVLGVLWLAKRKPSQTFERPLRTTMSLGFAAFDGSWTTKDILMGFFSLSIVVSRFEKSKNFDSKIPFWKKKKKLKDFEFYREICKCIKNLS